MQSLTIEMRICMFENEHLRSILNLYVSHDNIGLKYFGEYLIF